MAALHDLMRPAWLRCGVVLTLDTRHLAHDTSPRASALWGGHLTIHGGRISIRCTFEVVPLIVFLSAPQPAGPGWLRRLARSAQRHATMAIAVKCRCGTVYNLRDEYAGQWVQCPRCGQTMQVPVPPAVERIPQADPVFDRDVFLLRQKHLAISEKYVVADEDNQPILFVQRPVYLARGCLAILGGVAAFVVVGGAWMGLVLAVPHGPLQIVVVLVGIVAAIAALVVALVALYPKRHVYFYRDDSKQDKLLEVLQDRKFMPIVATYTIRDASGSVLARLRKNILTNLLRKKWWCYNPDGSVRCVVKEDSVILSLLRRFLGPLFGILRTNFIYCDAQTDEVIGEFNRKFTILDRYVLDLRADPARQLDRRVALAIGVMLDTGERR